jgi:hypothetical protein
VTDSTSTLQAILFGLGIFAIIVAVGWRSVQNRRILRLRGADGQETVIIAREDDEIESIVTTTETVRESAATAPATISDAEADVAARERLDRVVSSNP